MEVDASLTADLRLVAVHDRDLQKLLGRKDVKVGPPARQQAVYWNCVLRILGCCLQQQLAMVLVNAYKG